MPFLYSAQEYSNMHLIYGECGCNTSAAARLCREIYPNTERHPDYRVFVHVHQSYSKGRLPHVRKSGGRPQADYEDMVLDEVLNDAGTSSTIFLFSRGELVKYCTFWELSINMPSFEITCQDL
ncbi:hypothetical protein HHI36_008523, partial [Cryptolaemus montrouzieri]